MSDFPRTPNWRFEPGPGVLTLYTAYTTGYTAYTTDIVPTDAVTVTGKLAETLVDCLSWIVEQEFDARNARYENPEPDPSPSSADLDEWARTLEGVARQMREAGES